MNFNIYKYTTIILFISIIGLLIHYFSIQNELYELKVKNTVDIDKIQKQKDSVISDYQHKFDSIIKIPPKIKWKKYEKSIYIDRSLDDALSIHAEYKSNTISKK